MNVIEIIIKFAFLTTDGVSANERKLEPLRPSYWIFVTKASG